MTGHNLPAAELDPENELHLQLGALAARIRAAKTDKEALNCLSNFLLNNPVGKRITALGAAVAERYNPPEVPAPQPNAGLREAVAKVFRRCFDDSGEGDQEIYSLEYADQVLALLPGSDKGAEPTYPCDDCGKLRTKAEGGTTFTVCDACWDKHYGKKPSGEAEIQKAPVLIVNIVCGEGGIAVSGCHRETDPFMNTLSFGVLEEKYEVGKDLPLNTPQKSHRVFIRFTRPEAVDVVIKTLEAIKANFSAQPDASPGAPSLPKKDRNGYPLCVCGHAEYEHCCGINECNVQGHCDAFRCSKCLSVQCSCKPPAPVPGDMVQAMDAKMEANFAAGDITRLVDALETEMLTVRTVEEYRHGMLIENAKTAILDAFSTLQRERDRVALDAVDTFVARVNARAESEILKTHNIAGAHHRAMEAELSKIHAARAVLDSKPEESRSPS